MECVTQRHADAGVPVDVLRHVALHERDGLYFAAVIGSAMWSTDGPGNGRNFWFQTISRATCRA